MPLLTIPFGDWTPDVPPYKNPGTTVARNVIPTTGGYKPFFGASVISDALTARCQGARTTLDKSGNVRIYAADATKLYVLSTSQWTNATGSAALDIAAGERVEFAQWGETCIATYLSTGTTEMQSISLGSASFGDLIASGTKPRGAHIAVVHNDFVMLGRTYDASDGVKPQRVWWGPIGDPGSSWAPDPTTQCDFQDLDASDGWIRKVVGRDYGTIVMEKAIVRASYVGSDVIFQFDKIVSNRGALCSGSVASLDRLVFFLDAAGFHAFDGATVTPIGKNKVDNTFFAELNADNIDKIASAIDPINSVAWWAYPTSGSLNCDKMIGYHWPTGRWADAEVTTEFLMSSQSPGYTLESLDTVSSSIDELTPSLDDRYWTGGARVFTSFNTDHKLASFAGNALTADLETGEIQPYNGNRTYVGGIRPLIDGADATTTIQVGTRERMTASNVYGSALSLDGDGKANTRKSGRYVRFRANISGGFDFAQGLETFIAPAGAR